MIAAAGIVAMLATLGWLVLNIRALQSQGLSFEKKAMMAAAWALLIAGLAFVLSRSGA